MGTRIFNIVATLLLLVLFDGCAFRDPFYELPYGYRIASISNSSPFRVWCTSFETDDFAQAQDPRAFASIILCEEKPGFEDVFEWAADEDHLIGDSASGRFILEYQTRVVDLYNNRKDWEQALHYRTGLGPESPGKASSVAYSRSLPILIFYVAVLAVGVVPNIWPDRDEAETVRPGT